MKRTTVQKTTLQHKQFDFVNHGPVYLFLPHHHCKNVKGLARKVL